jgi:hypothetical protein
MGKEGEGKRKDSVVGFMQVPRHFPGEGFLKVQLMQPQRA